MLRKADVGISVSRSAPPAPDESEAPATSVRSWRRCFRRGTDSSSDDSRMRLLAVLCSDVTISNFGVLPRLLQVLLIQNQSVLKLYNGTGAQHSGRNQAAFAAGTQPRSSFSASRDIDFPGSIQRRIRDCFLFLPGTHAEHIMHTILAWLHVCCTVIQLLVLFNMITSVPLCFLACFEQPMHSLNDAHSGKDDTADRAYQNLRRCGLCFGHQL